MRCAECGYVTGTTSSGTPTNDYYYYRCRSRYNVKSGCTNGRGVRADVLEREVWRTVSSALLRPDLLRADLEKMVESERGLAAGAPAEQIVRWSDQVDKARIKRSRYQDQEAEGLMTREELRAKLAKLDETVNLAEAKMGKLRSHEERLRAMEKSGEELLKRYSELVPAELENLSPAGRRHIHQLLRVEVSVPKQGEVRIRLPFLPDDAPGVCRQETACCYRL